MTDRFEICLAETLWHESGERQRPGAPIRRGEYSYSDDPHDPGGKTMLGVLQRVYDGWRESRRMPRRPVRDITDDEVRTIYLDNYWALVRGDELPLGVDLAVFDFGVNSGCSRAIKYLQRIVGVVPDGALGAVTLAAVRRHDPAVIVARLNAERRAFLQQLPHYWRFGRGWMTRMDRVELACVRDLAERDWHPVVVEPPPAAREESGAGRATADPPETMAQSTTGNTAVGVGGAGAVQMGVDVGRAAASAQQAGGFDVIVFLTALAQSPTFWASVITIGGAVYVWLERRAKIRDHAV